MKKNSVLRLGVVAVAVTTLIACSADSPDTRATRTKVTRRARMITETTQVSDTIWKVRSLSPRGVLLAEGTLDRIGGKNVFTFTSHFGGTPVTEVEEIHRDAGYPLTFDQFHAYGLVFTSVARIGDMQTRAALLGRTVAFDNNGCDMAAGPATCNGKGKCCDHHDDCYQNAGPSKYDTDGKCSSKGWKELITVLPWNLSECAKCNARVVGCFANPFEWGDSRCCGRSGTDACGQPQNGSGTWSSSGTTGDGWFGGGGGGGGDGVITRAEYDEAYSNCWFETLPSAYRHCMEGQLAMMSDATDQFGVDYQDVCAADPRYCIDFDGDGLAAPGESYGSGPCNGDGYCDVYAGECAANCSDCTNGENCQ